MRTGREVALISDVPIYSPFLVRCVRGSRQRIGRLKRSPPPKRDTEDRNPAARVAFFVKLTWTGLHRTDLPATLMDDNVLYHS